MRALLRKDQSWVTIDTRFLSNNQYNTIETNERIFDRDILRMENDVRDGLGLCGYCGAIIAKNPGVELNGGILPIPEEHFQAMESKSCAECWWYQDRCIQRDVEKIPEQIDSVSLGGDQFRKTTVSKRIITEIYEKQCTWKSSSARFGDGHESACTNTQHRRYESIGSQRKILSFCVILMVCLPMNTLFSTFAIGDFSMILSRLICTIIKKSAVTPCELIWVMRMESLLV